jgi:phosphoribosylaminoimidazole carboxylase (NCAIR synthetase)
VKLVHDLELCNNYQRLLYENYQTHNYDKSTCDIDRKLLHIRIKMNNVKHKIQRLMDNQKGEI